MFADRAARAGAVAVCTRKTSSHSTGNGRPGIAAAAMSTARTTSHATITSLRG
nr:hypothetical protein [Thermostaphylospora chromogena]